MPDAQPRIVAVSADAFAPADEGFRSAGFDGSLAKPFRLADLVQVMRATGVRRGRLSG